MLESSVELIVRNTDTYDHTSNCFMFDEKS